MTEDEAKTKTCVRTLAPVHDPSGGVIWASANCIGSACMVWRDIPQTPRVQQVAFGDARTIDEVPAPGQGWVLKGRVSSGADIAEFELAPPRAGFCGLAGNS